MEVQLRSMLSQADKEKPVALVVLLEGTGNDSGKPSAITRLRGFLAQTPNQLVYLGAGSGTHPHGSLKGSLFGRDTEEIVLRAYEWLTVRFNVRSSCKSIGVYLFGFSRGAYQVRLLAELLNDFGIPKDEQCCRMIVHRFMSGEDPKQMINCTHVPKVKYMGLIDTVVSAPLLRKPRAEVPTNVVKGRHAVAIHDSRRFFAPVLLRSNSAGCVEERSFLGAHSDVGWGYSETKVLGKVALNWLVEPVVDELEWVQLLDDPSAGRVNMCILAKCAWFILHDTHRTMSNLWGLLGHRERRLQSVRPHKSAEVVREITETIGLSFGGKSGSIFQTFAEIGLLRKMRMCRKSYFDRVSKKINANMHLVSQILDKHGENG